MFWGNIQLQLHGRLHGVSAKSQFHGHENNKSHLTCYVYLPIPDFSPAMADCRLPNPLRTTPQSPSFPMLNVIFSYVSINGPEINAKLSYPEEKT
jgi:hypothetical protein